MAGQIEASEIYLKNLFDDKYLFEIPYFQRQFAWDKENFEQLIEDIDDAIDTFGDNEPYFLGSVILWTKELKDDGSGSYAVIDGQQRLTSLVILMGCLRDLAQNQMAKNNLQGRIYQEEDEFSGTEECVRVKVRDQESDFFKEYILSDGGTQKFESTNVAELSEPKQHIAQAVSIFLKYFKNDGGVPDQSMIEIFIKYLLQRVVIVAVKTTSLTSSFRLFNIINARGLPLSVADLLKSENLRMVVEQERSKYAKIWEDIEEDLGIDDLEMLISFIRSMTLKEKAKKAIFDEFEDKIFKDNPGFKGIKFIEYLERVSSIYRKKISEPNINIADRCKEVYYFNLVSIMRDFLPFNDWISALIRFDDKFSDDESFFRFFQLFERKIAVEWVRGLTLTERLTQIFNVIKLIDNSANPEDVINNSVFDLHSHENDFCEILNVNNLYNKARTRIPKYLLLRIDMERRDNLHTKVSFSGDITVEHILPQTPTDHYWLSRFDEADRQNMTNAFGNLVLLNGRKNSKAGNKPFDLKVKDYFEKKSDFEVTNELKSLSEWNPDQLEERHANLIDEAINIWIK